MPDLLKPLIEEEIKSDKPENRKGWLKHIIKNSENKNFKEYLKYLETKGLTYEEVKAIKEFLEEFYKNTGYLWRPGSCRHIPKLCELGNEILQKSLAKKYFGNIITRSYDTDGHFFLVMLSYDGKEFVIDPTGVPVKEKTWVFPDDIRPYFGLVRHATGYHKIIYQNSILLETGV